jgi:hypothetical protein
MTTQRELQLPRTTVRAALISLSAYADIRGLTHDQVRDAIELDRSIVGAEHIQWAFDISTESAERRREIRILSCLLTEPNRDRTWSFEEVLQIIFPPSRHPGLHPAVRPNFVTGTELQRALSCDNDHILKLVADKTLSTLPGTITRPGPNGSPVIKFDSIKTFLHDRKL